MATRAGPEAFERQLYAEALQRGFLQAEKTLVIADGAVWIWNIAKDRYKDAVHRLDLWHVKEHLWEVANDIYGIGSAEARAWISPVIKQLENNPDGAIKTINPAWIMQTQKN